jgi:lipoprotein-anchoring transpeptidase ErfK/SrfK
MSTVRRLWLPVALASTAALGLSGCSLGQLGIHAGSVSRGSSATITISPTATGKPVAPSSPVVVKVAGGRLTDVVVAGPSGDLAGTLSVDGHTWTSDGSLLDYGTAYSVSAKAVDRVGLATDLTQTIHTVAPSKFLGVYVSPSDGATVGVGMPITINTDHRLKSTTTKAMLEKNLAVTVDGAPAGGSWRWVTDKVLEYRPQSYWPGHATIAITTAIKGVRFDSSLWGEKNSTVTFHTGASMISYVNMITDQLRVTRDGATIRTIPITTGKAGFETRSGVKVIVSKERTRLMDASTGGTLKNDPEYYRLTVEYAMRLTYSGEFLHAAPWSVAHQGHSNVSHGCTGMSTSNARWLYENSEPGDVVVYTGTSRQMEVGNGIGVWNMSWAHWQQHSALA